MQDESSGPYICPICGTEMIARKKGYTVEGYYLGSFDSVICPNCGKSFITEAGILNLSRKWNEMEAAGVIPESVVYMDQELGFSSTELVSENIIERTTNNVTSNVSISYDRERRQVQVKGPRFEQVTSA